MASAWVWPTGEAPHRAGVVDLIGDPVQSISLSSGETVKAFFTMSNHFGQPIRKFQLYANVNGHEEIVWETSIANGEEKQSFVDIPTAVFMLCNSEYRLSSEFRLSCRAELENGQVLSQNFSLRADKRVFSLDGGWTTAYHRWPNDEESYEAMRIALIDSH